LIEKAGLRFGFGFGLGLGLWLGLRKVRLGLGQSVQETTGQRQIPKYLSNDKAQNGPKNAKIRAVKASDCRKKRERG
jgi:hypothetical protein